MAHGSELCFFLYPREMVPKIWGAGIAMETHDRGHIDNASHPQIEHPMVHRVDARDAPEGDTDLHGAIPIRSGA